MGPRYRLTETERTTERSERKRKRKEAGAGRREGKGDRGDLIETKYLDARLQEAPSDWWLLRILCPCSLKLMEMKGYVGGLGAYGV